MHLEKLAGAIHPLLDAPPVDIPGVTSGSLRKRLAAAKTLKPIIKCGVLEMQLLLLANISFLKEKPYSQFIDICSGFFHCQGLKLGANLPDFYEIVTAPITKVCKS